MKAALVAGAEIDFATPEEVRREIHRYFDRKPIRERLFGSAIIPTPTAFVVIDLGSPPQGYRWDARHVTICGVDPTVAFTGTGVVCIGTPKLDAAGKMNAFDAWSASTTLPADVSYSKDQAIIQGNDHLYVVVAAATQATVAIAHAMVFSEPLKAMEFYDA